jgi:4-amino-4-deoxy-L-arabinose transferase-like glycosyltransferase
VFGGSALLVSLAWILLVEVWPASSRPYIGGSTNNSAINLAIDYNGLGRLDGEDQGSGGGINGRTPQRPSVNVPNPNGPAGAPNRQGAGGIIAGRPGLLRMFDAANGGQIGWLLPFAVLGGLFSAYWWRRSPLHRSFVALWLGWVLVCAVVFSYAQGIYHSYYTALMAPGVATLTGVGFMSLGSALRRNWKWLALAAALLGATIYVQMVISGRVPAFYGGIQPYTIGLGLASFALLGALVWRKKAVAPALALASAGLLLLPSSWALSETAHASLNTSLPQAGPRQGAAGVTFGSRAFDTGTAELATWLKAHAEPEAHWNVVASRAQEGSTLIAEYSLSVMALGGFLGRDPTITVQRFADLVAQGDVRYVLAQGQGSGRQSPTSGIPGRTPAFPGGLPTPGGQGPRAGNSFPGFGGPPGQVPQGGGVTGGGQQSNSANVVMQAVQRACTLVTDPTLPARYQGTLFDCAGHADALR